MAIDLRSSELQNAFIKERINEIEKHINNICSKLSNYNKKLALLKDSGDDLAKSLQNFVSKETLNQSFKSAVHEFSDIIVSLQNERDIQIKRIDLNAIQELTKYDPICRKTKDEFKRSHETMLLAIKKQNQLQKLQAKNQRDLQKIALAEKEANLAREEAVRDALEMSHRLNSFERKKLENIKHILLDFIKIEMMLCAKSIEKYTAAYNTIKNINIDKDLNEFVCHYKALTVTLDNQCLTSYHTNKQTGDKKDNSKIQPIPTENQRNIVSSTSKTVLPKLSGSHSSLNSIPESNFDFGDETL